MGEYYKQPLWRFNTNFIKAVSKIDMDTPFDEFEQILCGTINNRDLHRAITIMKDNNCTTYRHLLTNAEFYGWDRIRKGNRECFSLCDYIKTFRYSGRKLVNIIMLIYKFVERRERDKIREVLKSQGFE